MQPDLLSNRLERPALPCQVADLLIAQAPVDVTRELLCSQWQEGGRLRRRHLDDRGLVHERQGGHRGRHVERL
jgi:hypothetical protein